MQLRKLAAGAAMLLAAGCSSIVTVYDESRENGKEQAVTGNYHLGRTILTVRVTDTDSGKQLHVTKSTEADPDMRVAFDFAHLPWFSDDLKVTLDSDNLLSNVATITDDRTTEIAKTLTNLIFTSVTGVSRTRAVPGADTDLNKVVVVSYDPFDFNEADRARTVLRKAGVCVLVGSEVDLGTDQCRSGAPKMLAFSQVVRPALSRESKRSPGLYHRAPAVKAIALYTRSSAKAAWEPRFVGNERFLDKTSLYRIALKRYALVESKFTINYQNGTLKDIQVEKPSEIEELANIANDIVQAVFAAPLAGLQRDKGLIDAEKNLLNSRAELIQAQKKLMELQATTTTDERAVLVPSTTRLDLGPRSFLDSSDLASDIRRSFERNLLREINRSFCEPNVPANAEECIGYIGGD